ncbi:hypothetical protein TcBrA4_0093630 [Trypanosoma cruzi]|nr:hypothetical protein TcBrA4_0093630 [Trypanosoma cruzi]
METNVGMQRQESGSPKELAGTRAQKTPEAAAEFDYRELGEAAAQEFEEYSSASGAAPVRRSSIRFVLASIEEKENELRELEAREKAVESQLQVYSEVIGLRKELRLVKEETERVRQQLDSINVFAESTVMPLNATSILPKRRHSGPCAAGLDECVPGKAQ